MDNGLEELLKDREKSFELAWHCTRELSLKNIEGKRTYLQTLLLILFVSAGFALTIEKEVVYWCLFLSVVLYLLCALGICFYLSFLMTREGKFLDKHLNYLKRQRIDLVTALENDEINDSKSFEKFRQEKYKDELEFRKKNSQDLSDFWFWIISAIFMFGTSFLLLGYTLKQYCMYLT